ncbi:element excision factor XisH family protein [Cyanothece sp. BG0011]|uniref:element excision factor XisH family protein n=1 Tax=Cyanothece sp. BG0011 TaxID=2082950 RepID=UPI0018E4EA70|nr:element excision factor XisH family protein [Cyanothece sp. BG0011]
MARDLVHQAVKKALLISFLAVPSFTYDTFLSLEFTQLMIKENQLKIIIFDPDQEVIISWIN